MCPCNTGNVSTFIQSVFDFTLDVYNLPRTYTVYLGQYGFHLGQWFNAETHAEIQWYCFEKFRYEHLCEIILFLLKLWSPTCSKEHNNCSKFGREQHGGTVKA